MKYIVTWICGLCIGLSHSNRYDPHVFPEKGPFFEGWYMRTVDTSQSHSFAVLFGTVLPQANSSNAKLAYIGLLKGEPGKQLQSYPAFPPVQSINITVNGGEPVTKNPDKTSPPWFTLSTEHNGFITVKEDTCHINITVNSIHFTLSLGTPAPWGKNGDGPGENMTHMFIRLGAINM